MNDKKKEVMSRMGKWHVDFSAWPFACFACFGKASKWPSEKKHNATRSGAIDVCMRHVTHMSAK